MLRACLLCATSEKTERICSLRVPVASRSLVRIRCVNMMLCIHSMLPLSFVVVQILCLTMVGADADSEVKIDVDSER